MLPVKRLMLQQFGGQFPDFADRLPEIRSTSIVVAAPLHLLQISLTKKADKRQISLLHSLQMSLTKKADKRNVVH